MSNWLPQRASACTVMFADVGNTKVPRQKAGEASYHSYFCDQRKKANVHGKIKMLFFWTDYICILVGHWLTCKQLSSISDDGRTVSKIDFRTRLLSSLAIPFLAHEKGVGRGDWRTANLLQLAVTQRRLYWVLDATRPAQ